MYEDNDVYAGDVGITVIIGIFLLLFSVIISVGVMSKIITSDYRNAPAEHYDYGLDYSDDSRDK